MNRLGMSLLSMAAIIVVTFSIITPSKQEMSPVSGTIRWVSATQWEALDDPGHVPLGIDTVTVHPTYVRVDYDFTADRVGSCQVTVDEAFASANVRVGASVGVDHLIVYFYMPSYGSTPVPPALLSKANANVWITCFHHVEEVAP